MGGCGKPGEVHVTQIGFRKDFLFVLNLAPTVKASCSRLGRVCADSSSATFVTLPLPPLSRDGAESEHTPGRGYP